MRDIPIFTTENGACSLILREIPYKKDAYIIFGNAPVSHEFVEECVSFCRMAGAEHIYAKGSLSGYGIYTTVWKMVGAKRGGTDAVALPVTEETLEVFRHIYNDKMRVVPGAAYVSLGDAQELLGSAYTVSRGGMLLGIGVVRGSKVEAIAACVPGAGKDVLSALCELTPGGEITLEVAENNLPAMKLYEKCGFVKKEIAHLWYKIL